MAKWLAAVPQDQPAVGGAGCVQRKARSTPHGLPEGCFLFAGAEEPLFLVHRSDDLAPVFAQRRRRVPLVALRAHSVVRAAGRGLLICPRCFIVCWLKELLDALNLAFALVRERLAQVLVELPLVAADRQVLSQVLLFVVLLDRAAIQPSQLWLRRQKIQTEEAILDADLDGHDPPVPDEPDEDPVRLELDESVAEVLFVVVVRSKAKIRQIVKPFTKLLCEMAWQGVARDGMFRADAVRAGTQSGWDGH